MALAEGASPAVAGLLLSMLGIGRVLGDVPSAWLADRLGDRRAMLVAAAITGAGLVVATLGADAAPRDDRNVFLSIFRLLGDAGNAAGPSGRPPARRS